MKATKHLMLLTAFLLLVGALVFAITACGDDDDDDDDDAVGSLEFYANGEEFIRDGFTSMDGWRIDFTHFWVYLQGFTAYQYVEESTEEQKILPAHAGHPHEDIPEGTAHETLLDTYAIDLALGEDRTLVDTIDDAPVGNYNYIAFNMVQGNEGFSIIMQGTASKGEDSIDFTIQLTEEMTFSSCHQEVDDEYAGVVDEGGLGTVESTFHSDHVFGDEETLGEEDSVNEIALGFQAIYDLMTDLGVNSVTQQDLADGLGGEDYLTFMEAVKTLGHSGEGHCEYSDYEAEE